MTDASLAADRNEYRAIRAEVCGLTGMTTKDFDFAAMVHAHEIADGEEVTSGCWVRGAAESLWRVRHGKAA